MESNNEIKVRKGAWTKEEDILLTKCIQNFGEGKWHLVPPRAGLNRCRKSCRMRWLNYLKPNVKRGYFDPAEVELLRRLHKLLGNRWSLIAGRIPGRTANNIKNFWNTHICKKQPSKTVVAAATHTTTNILIKPRPRRFTISTSHSQSQLLFNNNADVESKNALPLINDDDEDKDQDQEVHECNQWWREMLQMSENGEGNDSHTDHDGFMSDLFMDFHVWGDII